MENIRILTAEVDGKKIGYLTDTDFLVQVGKNKSAYDTRYIFKGDVSKAVFHYKSINIGNGYKKRLLMPSCSKNPVIARAKS